MMDYQAENAISALILGTPSKADCAYILKEMERLKKDADRYALLRDIKCNQFHLSLNDGHASNYVTAKQWIEDYSPEWFAGCSPDELEKMKTTNTIWDFQIYPNTPVGFNVYHGATLDAAIDAAKLDAVDPELSALLKEQAE